MSWNSPKLSLHFPTVSKRDGCFTLHRVLTVSLKTGGDLLVHANLLKPPLSVATSKFFFVRIVLLTYKP